MAKELERLRKICLAIPGAFEKLSHGEPTWFTGPKGKVFAMFDNHHHGAAHISAYFAASIEAQELLVAEDPERYWVPPYVGHKGWIAVVLDTKPDWNVVARLAQEAFAMITAAKPARMQSRRASR
jgi:predicted DNA-binding protein (MmcQ/YjbR family)